MANQAGKRFGLGTYNVEEETTPKKTGGLSFSEGFKYQDPNLNNVQTSEKEAQKLNNEKLEKFLGEDISSKKMTDKEIEDFTKTLDRQQLKWISTVGSGFSTNGIVSYINKWDERKNPFAEGTGMFEKRGKTFSPSTKRAGAYILGTLGGAEVVGRSMSALGSYQFNRTMDKYLPEDVSRLTRYTKYEKVPNVLSEELAKTNEQIEKAEQRLGKSIKNKLVNGGVNDETRRNLEELYARRDAIKESLDAIESTKKKLPEGKPETARETAKRMNLKGNDLRAAGQAATESSVYYTTEIAPLYKQVTAKFNMGDVFDSLTKDDFPGLTESEWNDMKEVIEKEKKAYAKYTDISAEELHKKLSDFDLSKQRIKGEEAKGLNAQFKDAVHTKINNLLDDAVERELPGQSIKNKKIRYNNMLNIENELKDYAVSGGKRKSQSVMKDLRDSTTRSVKLKRGLGTNLRKAGNAITPTKQIYNAGKKIVDGIKNLASKLKNTATVAVKETVESANPKNFKQPKLLGGEAVGTLQLLEGLGGLWDSVLGGNTQVGDIADKISQLPGVTAADALDDLLRTSYERSLLSEEEKPYYMKDVLEEIYPGETFTIEEAEELYRQLKENGSIYLGERTSA